ncbi:MAG: hypothetical protein HN737_02155 [Desulfobacterales bacterium]|nr:hypothetical protein [Desulfobacteraceae bacterium]MBT4363719.1 hypothetical protein [Desulfobacteraceae bacterium]MBT7086466.1 hypothetical protein [Desulfobacterales bacterium]MBT7696193.1 hypothetical protein [Desulfobacterales bacterium]
MYEFIRGPMAWVSFLIFISGSAYQIIGFFRNTSKQEEFAFSKPSYVQHTRGQPVNKKLLSFKDIKYSIKYSMIGFDPFFSVITIIFHICILILPFLLYEHNAIFEILWGFPLSPFTLPENVSDILTFTIIACIFYFILRRIFIRRVRSITTFYDYYILFIVAAPFITGFLLLHNIFSYKTIAIFHILSVELLFISLPFSKLSHMFFFILNRFYIRNEFSFGKGDRIW